MTTKMNTTLLSMPLVETNVETTPDISGDKNASSFVGVHIDETARVIFIAIATLEILCGVFGNWLLLTVLLTRRSLHVKNYHHLFIANLAVADLLSLGYWMTYFVLDLILGRHPVVSDIHCRINAFIICTCTAVGVLSLVCISLNRYLHVCHNRLYTRVFSLRHIIAYTSLAWLVGAIIATPPTFLKEAGIYRYNKVFHFCSYDRRKGSGLYSKATVMVFCVVPMCLVGYWNLAIFCHWKKVSMNVSARFPLLRQHSRRLSFWLPRRNKNTGSRTNSERLSREANRNARVGSFRQEHQEIPLQSCKKTRGSSSTQSSIVQSPVHSPVLRSRNLAVKAALNSAAEKAKKCSPLAARKTGEDRKEEARSKAKSLPNLSSKRKGKKSLGSSQGELDFAEKSRKIKTLRAGLKAPPRIGDDIDWDEDSDEDLPPVHLFPKPTNHPPYPTDLPENSGDTVTSEFTAPESSVHDFTDTSTPGSTSAIKKLRRRVRKERAKEEAFLRSLFVVFLVMALTFLPYGILLMVETALQKPLPAELAISGSLLLFLNCSVNWIVYGVMNRSFRQGYLRRVRDVLTKCCKNPCPKFLAEDLNTSMLSIPSGSTAWLDKTPEPSYA